MKTGVVMGKAYYVGVLSKDPESDYGVDFPDFPGCVTAGRTVAETLALAEEVLEFHVEGMLEHGEDVPWPTPLDKVDVDDGIPLPGSAASQSEIQRINITVNKGTLERIDGYAKAHGMSRSAFLVEAARGAMGTGKTRKVATFEPEEASK